MDDALHRLEAAGAFRSDCGDPASLRAVAAYHLAHGLDEDTIVRSIEGDYISAVGFQRMLTGGDLSARDVATETGRPLDEVVNLFRLLGVAVPDADSPRFLPEEAQIVALMSDIAGTFDDGESADILRAAATALTLVAETVVAAFVGGIEERLEREEMPLMERTEFTEAMGQTGIDFGKGLGTLYRHHLQASIERQRASMSANDRHLRHMAIGFVDLVGFTPLSTSLDTHALLDVVRDFESRAFDVASRFGGRIVKHIGDEVMVASSSVDDACTILLTLIAEFEGDTTQPRAGVAYGEVLTRQGDYYGPMVNLAARLVDEAVPGEVLADAAVVEACERDTLRFEPAGRRMCKGFADPIAVVSVKGP